MDHTSDLRSFRRGDQDAARALILRGLEARFGTLDPALNRDLDDIVCATKNR